jgi:hypothetical protein
MKKHVYFLTLLLFGLWNSWGGTNLVASPQADKKEELKIQERILFSTVYKEKLVLTKLDPISGKRNFLSHLSAGFTSVLPEKNLGDDFSPVASNDGRWIAFYSNRADAVNLWLCDPLGKQQRQLTFHHNNIASFEPDLDGKIRFSPDSKNIAFLNHGNIWIYSLEENSLNALTHYDNISTLEWTPQGKNIVYERKGSLHIIAAKGAPHSVLVQNTLSWPTLFARDSFIYFFQKGLWRIQTENKKTQRIFGSWIAPNRIKISPDGKLACLIGPSPERKPELFIIDLEKNFKSERVTRGGADFPIFSADSKTIFFLRDLCLWRINTDGKAARPLTFTQAYLPVTAQLEISGEKP